MVMRCLLRSERLAKPILKYLEEHGKATYVEICNDNPDFDRAEVLRLLKKMNGYWVKTVTVEGQRHRAKYWKLV